MVNQEEKKTPASETEDYLKMKEDMIILDNDATMVKKLLMDNIV